MTTRIHAVQLAQEMCNELVRIVPSTHIEDIEKLPYIRLITKLNTKNTNDNTARAVDKFVEGILPFYRKNIDSIVNMPPVIGETECFSYNEKYELPLGRCFNIILGLETPEEAIMIHDYIVKIGFILTGDEKLGGIMEQLEMLQKMNSQETMNPMEMMGGMNPLMMMMGGMGGMGGDGDVPMPNPMEMLGAMGGDGMNPLAILSMLGNMSGGADGDPDNPFSQLGEMMTGMDSGNFNGSEILRVIGKSFIKLADDMENMEDDGAGIGQVDTSEIEGE